MMESVEIFGIILLVVTTLYGFMICAFTIGLARLRKAGDPQHMPFTGFVSVIIAVRNEELSILNLLEELRSQDFPVDRMEILVADDFSGDATMALASRFALVHPGFPLVLIPSGDDEDSTSRGKKRAIERAVAGAKGEVLLFTDADTGRGPGWISSMVSGFASPHVRMVLGPVCFCNERNLLQKIQSLEFMGLMGTTAGSAAIGFPVMCNGANLAYMRDAFVQTGGFGKNLRYASGDDQFMMSAIRKRYGKEALIFNADPRAWVRTEPEATFKGFVNQRLRWVSKSKGYRDPVVIFTGGVTYLANVLLLAGMLLGLFHPAFFCVSLLFWLMKILLEYPLVSGMARFFCKQELRRYYLLAQVFQLVYVPLAGILGLILPYKWKGRKI